VSLGQETKPWGGEKLSHILDLLQDLITQTGGAAADPNVVKKLIPLGCILAFVITSTKCLNAQELPQVSARSQIWSNLLLRKPISQYRLGERRSMNCVVLEGRYQLNNLAQEMSPLDARFRKRLAIIFDAWRKAVASAP
jgi:hypothetical protein